MLIRTLLTFCCFQLALSLSFHRQGKVFDEDITKIYPHLKSADSQAANPQVNDLETAATGHGEDHHSNSYNDGDEKHSSFQDGDKGSFRDGHSTSHHKEDRDSDKGSFHNEDSYENHHGGSKSTKGGDSGSFGHGHSNDGGYGNENHHSSDDYGDYGYGGDEEKDSHGEHSSHDGHSEQGGQSGHGGHVSHNDHGGYGSHGGHGGHEGHASKSHHDKHQGDHGPQGAYSEQKDRSEDEEYPDDSGTDFYLADDFEKTFKKTFGNDDGYKYEEDNHAKEDDGGHATHGQHGGHSDNSGGDSKKSYDVRDKDKIYTSSSEEPYAEYSHQVYTQLPRGAHLTHQPLSHSPLTNGQGGHLHGLANIILGPHDKIGPAHM